MFVILKVVPHLLTAISILILLPTERLVKQPSQNVGRSPATPCHFIHLINVDMVFIHRVTVAPGRWHATQE